MTQVGQKITLSPSRDIPFDKLRLSQSNVRRIKVGVSEEELAEDIQRRGLLQGLNVRPCWMKLASRPASSRFRQVGVGSRVTARLLPQGLVLDAGDDVWICDEVPEEVVPVFGGTSRTGQHVFDFADAVIG